MLPPGTQGPSTHGRAWGADGASLTADSPAKQPNPQCLGVCGLSDTISTPVSSHRRFPSRRLERRDPRSSATHPKMPTASDGLALKKATPHCHCQLRREGASCGAVPTRLHVPEPPEEPRGCATHSRTALPAAGLLHHGSAINLGQVASPVRSFSGTAVETGHSKWGTNTMPCSPNVISERWEPVLCQCTQPLPVR